MKRTRKWAYVAQEATRLAALGLTPPEIAKRLDLERSTVQRWMQAGKIADTRRTTGGRSPVVPETSGSSWAAAVRSAFALDASDLELVRLGEVALAAASDPREGLPVRLQAIGRFQAIVKQLALVARAADAPQASPAPTPSLPARRTGTDPRHLLMAVK